ncbi:MAG: cupin domain-containing protein [Burkholderiales bacterium]
MKASSKRAKSAPFVANVVDVPWQEYPGHFGGALSKPLVRPETCGSRRIDYRISSYQPMAHVAEHVHKVQEQVYHVLDGEGVLTLDDRRVVLRRHDYVCIPPGVRHSFTNEGLSPLVFLVVTSPVEDGPAPE